MGFLRVVGKSLATTVIFFLFMELALRAAYFGRNALVRYVPLPYTVGDDYGPIPPWLDNLLILRPDDTLIWKNIPNARRAYVDIFAPVWSDADRMALLRRFAPWLPSAFRANPVWRIALNDDGFRSGPMTREKKPGATRIACIGDSWTFGMNVNQDATYPSRLEAVLKQQEPHIDFDIMNFGVLGYSSFQGLELLKRRVLDLHPDVLLIGFGMNDSGVAGYRDRDVGHASVPAWRDRVKAAADASEVYGLLKYFALVLRFHPQTMGDFLRADARTESAKGSDPVNYADIEPWTRVSPPDYERNIREMVTLARSHGARALLLDNELWPESPYRPVLAAIARDEHIPLVDSLRIIADEKMRIERGMEARFHLEPAVSGHDPSAASGSQETTVVFRVYEGSYAVPRSLSIVGNHPALGNLVPNTVVLHDDGTNGDERAGDHVWSVRGTFPAGTRLKYVYTNSGHPGQWEGLDVPRVRELQVEPSADGQPVYLPIESFGRIYMQADNWHTDAVGYDLIAKSVAAALETALTSGN
jgi:lysophospholipase L1-like esterase